MLNFEKEEENTVKLENALIVKVFGDSIPFHVI